MSKSVHMHTWYIHICFYVAYDLATYYYHCFAYIALCFTASNELKLDRYVSAVMLGFQSIDDTVRSTQLMYKGGRQRKIIAVEHIQFFEFLLDHFYCPNGTVLDISCDTEVKYYNNMIC